MILHLYLIFTAPSFRCNTEPVGPSSDETKSSVLAIMPQQEPHCGCAEPCGVVLETFGVHGEMKTNGYGACSVIAVLIG